MCLLQGLCFEHVLYPWRHAFLVFITSERSEGPHAHRHSAQTWMGILCTNLTWRENASQRLIKTVILEAAQPCARAGLPTKDLCILRVPHPFAFFAKGWGFPILRLNYEREYSEKLILWQPLLRCVHSGEVFGSWPNSILIALYSHFGVDSENA